MKIHEQNLKLFWRYIAERHAIYKKKNIEKIPAPWTNDTVLQEYKFTNVFRDLDPGTKYVIEKLIPEWSRHCEERSDAAIQEDDFLTNRIALGENRSAAADHARVSLSQDSLRMTDLGDLLFNLIIYRLYNKPLTSDAVGWQEVGKYDRKKFEQKLRKLKTTGEKVFTNAYLVSGYEQYASFGDKIARTSKLLEDIARLIPGVVSSLGGSLSQTSIRDGNPKKCHSGLDPESSTRIFKEDPGFHQDDNYINSKNTYESIRSLPGLGEFLAYQIAVDLGYARRDLYDESIHVVAGPGCKRGLDRLFMDRGKMSYKQAIVWLVEHQEEGFTSIGVDPDKLFSDRKVPRLNLMAIENCLCEISKYLKVKYGEGRPRNRYQGRIKN